MSLNNNGIDWLDKIPLFFVEYQQLQKSLVCAFNSAQSTKISIWISSVINYLQIKNF